MDLEAVLRSPEGKTVEFKRDLSSSDGVLRSVGAFANTAGGVLVVGVEDTTRRVVGCSDPLGDEEKLASLIADRIEPRLVPDIAIVPWRRTQLLVVTVQLSPLRPHRVRLTNRAGAVYVRLGSTNREADAQLVAQLQREAEGVSFDECPLAHLDASGIDLAVVREAFAGRRTINSKELRTLRLTTRHQGRDVPTVAGIVLFGKERDRTVPDAWIQAGRFGGVDRADIIDSARFDGPPLAELDRVMQFIRRHTSTAISIEGVRRSERPEYPIAAVREALLNAVAHADYSQLGAPIRVSIFEDRLEIENPGVMPFGLTIDDVRSGVSRLRNHAIARVMNELELVEQWGSGIPRMTRACRDAGLPEPEFVEVAGRLRVILRSSGGAVVEISAADREIVEVLGRGPARTSDVAAALGKSIRWTRQRLNALVDAGMIVELGEGPNDPRRRYATATTTRTKREQSSRTRGRTSADEPSGERRKSRSIR
jgi:ATP-dependent DNA helicase RecG